MSVVDWRNMNPLICGEGEDATGRRLPDSTFRVDRRTGQVWKYATDETGQMLINETGDVMTVELQMVPPITVWLYT